MKMNCPQCRNPLTWRLLGSRLLPEKRRPLPHRVVRICPSCGAALTLNRHPKERLVLALCASLLLPLGVLLIADNRAFKWTAIILFMLIIVMMLYVNFRYLREWQRYALFTPNDR
jgi:hypothetical protein